MQLGIRTVEDWLYGKRFPPPDEQIKIIEYCKCKNISLPDGKEPSPKHFRNDPYPIWRLSKIQAQLDKDAMAAFRNKFSEFIFRMYQTELVYRTPEVIAYVKRENERLRESRDDERAKLIPKLKIIGIDFGSPDKVKSKIFFEVDDIKEIWAVREIGKSHSNIQVELHDGRVFTIYKKYNQFAFDLHIFPEPYQLYKQLKKQGKMKKSEGKFPKEYSIERRPFSGESMSIESVEYQYKIRVDDIIEDIEAGILPKHSVSRRDGRYFINSVVAWKYYGKRVNG